jgi:hypothetical protein
MFWVILAAIFWQSVNRLPRADAQPLLGNSFFTGFSQGYEDLSSHDPATGNPHLIHTVKRRQLVFGSGGTSGTELN